MFDSVPSPLSFSLETSTSSSTSGRSLQDSGNGRLSTSQESPSTGSLPYVLSMVARKEPIVVHNLTVGLQSFSSLESVEPFVSLESAFEGLRKVQDTDEFKTWTTRMRSSFSFDKINEEEFRWLICDEDENRYTTNTLLWAKGFALALATSQWLTHCILLYSLHKAG